MGLALRLHPDRLKTIEANHQDAESRLNAVIDRWLKTHRLPSWKQLVEAVAHPAGGSDHALADKIAI